MVENKTAVLPRLCLRFISELTEQSPEMKKAVMEFINDLGVVFQI
jgi:geranylgeranyl pyrophosphate synthase